MFRTILLIVAFLALSAAAWPCTVSIYRPLFEMDRTEFVFIGEVVGHSLPVQFEHAKRLPPELPHDDSIKQSSALIIKVLDKVFLPIDEAEFEVFQYGLGSSCETLGSDREGLQRNFPIGKRLMIVAREAVQVPTIAENGLRRLEASISRGLVADADAFLPRVSSTSVFNFGEVFKTDEWHRQTSRILFELRKELRRLEESASSKEKTEVLERVLKVPHRSYMVDFYRILNRNWPSEAASQKRLVEKLEKEGFEREQIDPYLVCRSNEMKEKGRKPFDSTCHINEARTK